jgi:hypothetical protein
MTSSAAVMERSANAVHCTGFGPVVVMLVVRKQGHYLAVHLSEIIHVESVGEPKMALALSFSIVHGKR